jgi:hypothetical protein
VQYPKKWHSTGILFERFRKNVHFQNGQLWEYGAGAHKPSRTQQTLRDECADFIPKT